MRYYIAIISIIFLLPSNAFGAASGPTVSERWGKFTAGIEYNEVFDRDLDPQDEDLNSYAIDSSQQVYGVFAYQVYSKDNITTNVYAKVGAADLKLEGFNNALGAQQIVEYEWGLAWGVGGNVTISVLDNWDLVIDGQYNEWELDLDRIEVSDTEAANIVTTSGGDEDANFTEVQASAALQTFMDFGGRQHAFTLAPYAGIFYNWSDLRTSDVNFSAITAVTGFNASAESESDNFLGLLVGAELYAKDNLRFKVDGRFLAEDAFALSGYYEF